MTSRTPLSNWGSWRAARLAVTCLIVTLLCGSVARAQVVRDGTMGPAGAVTGPEFAIPHTDGTVAGNNLFHSFSQFSIHTGESATFTGPDNIANLLSRVTGGSGSTIDGLLRTSGMPHANFFLINPAGVVFGPGAQIDVPAAFVVTTANVIELADGGRFALTLDPADTVLTSAPPSAFGFLDEAPASIQVGTSILEVGGGEAISLVGGDLQISGDLEAPGGRVSLISVASPGSVAYDASDQTADLDVGAFAALGRVELVDEGYSGWVTVAGDPGGTLVIRSGQLLLEGYNVTAQTQGAADHGGIGMDIHVTGDMLLQATPAGGAAEIACSSGGWATGNAGDTRIVAGTLEISGDPSWYISSNIGSRAFGAGDAGDVEITTDRLTLNGYTFISTPALSTGNGGDIIINAGTIELLGDYGYAYISSLSQGGGAAGTIDMTADSFLARGGWGGYVGVTTQTNQFGTGAPGDLRITANDLQLLDGAQINASLFNAGGLGGDIEVTADSILVSGRNPYWYPSGIFATAGDWGADFPLTLIGRGGSIRVSALDLEIADGGQISAYTTGRGGAGDIEIDARNVNIHSQGSVFAGSYDAGDGGDIRIATDTLNIEDRSFVSCSAWSPDPESDAGSMEVTARSILLAGPESSSDPFGWDFTGLATAAVGGGGGVLQVVAESLEMTNRAQIGSFTWGAGSAGDLSVDVGSLEMRNGANLVSSTFGSGAGGALTVTASTVLLSGVHPEPYQFLGGSLLAPTFIGSEAGSSGNAGQIVITADRLELLDGALISATTAGLGHAGTVDVIAQEVLVSGVNTVHEEFLAAQGRDPRRAGSGIYSAAVDLWGWPDPVTGDAGTIRVQAGQVYLTDHGRLSSETETSGVGGSIVLSVDDLHMINEGEITSSSTGMGTAGSIEVSAVRDIMMRDNALISTSAELADGGNFLLAAGRDIKLTNSRITAQASGDGGDIKLTASGTVDLLDSEITTQAGGSGGNITIDPVYTILDGSRLVADAILGDGGNILIVTDLCLPSHTIISASSEYGVDGTIQITSPFADVAGSLAQLPASLLSAGVRLADPCVTRFVRGASSFVIAGRDGLPAEPGAWLPSIELQTRQTADEEVD